CSSSMATLRVMVASSWRGCQHLRTLRPSKRVLINSLNEGTLQDAVRAALTTPWSNAQSEGHITKLKLLKRQMYGRASFDLLRRRALLAS
ncbi:hypothetical protein U8525_33815, partial [Corallococcus sp. RDP092CA]